MSRRTFIQTILTIILLFILTTGVYLYTSGYRVRRETTQKVDIEKTGMLSAKSTPKGAAVYYDDKVVTATDDTLSGLTPGKHKIKIIKNGYVPWSKEIEVFPELVTDITAVLISQTPTLQPLTNTGAKAPSVSSSMNKLAYFSKDSEKPGIWVIPLVQGAISLFRSDPYIVIQDKGKNMYSDGSTIIWSPDDKKLLVAGSEPGKAAFLIDLQTNTSQSTSSAEALQKEWDTEVTKKRTDFIEKLDLPEEIKKLATKVDTLWAPDDKKFLYTEVANDSVNYKVYNLEKPIPVGENVNTVVMSLPSKEPQPKVTWYIDSFHLITTLMDPIEKNRGVIRLIRIDGTNYTEIYNGTLYSDQVYAVPSGDKLIMLTSFKSAGQTDLYTIGIR